MDQNRRSLIKGIGSLGTFGCIATPVSARSNQDQFTNESSSKADQISSESLRHPGLISGRESNNPEESVATLAMEHEAHSNRPVIAFTSVNQEEGFQLYLAHGASTVDEVPDRIEQLTEAEYGVHSISWESGRKLRYSRDGATYEYTINSDQDETNQERQVDSEPLPMFELEEQVTILAKVVKCTNVPFVGDWCVRAHSGDSGHTPMCNNNPTPPSMVHSHFSVYPQSDAKGGMNLWAGKHSGCFYVGEEHYSGKCVRVCYDGKFPGLGKIADAYEELLLIAAAAAGIALAPAIAKALAYVLAGLTIKPPVGLPI